jgi:dihydrofolate synthase/folylpolyglutamate synthase
MNSLFSRQQILDHLFALTNRGIRFDTQRLHHLEEAAAELGSPQKNYSIIHVAGTNGKGSVCAMLEASLRGAGQRTGLYTSPHLVNFEERFIINGKPVQDQEWLAVYEAIHPLADRYGLTFFEITTLLAFELFSRAQVDWVVLETGLGGRLDATNIVTPRVSVIARIALDHAQYLGSTIQEVAAEKLGIVKPALPLVIAGGDPRIESLASAVCTRLQSPLHLCQDSEAHNVLQGPDGRWSFLYNGQQISAPFAGRHQVHNTLLVLRTLQQAGFDLTAPLLEGLEQATLPGRFQQVAWRGKTLLFDIAHNPDAAQTLVTTLAANPTPQHTLLVGIMKDKDIAQIAQALERYPFAQIICTSPSIDRACPAEQLATFFTHPRLSIAPTVAQALELACKTDGETVCITGSCYTVGEAMAELTIAPYAQNDGATRLIV